MIHAGSVSLRDTPLVSYHVAIQNDVNNLEPYRWGRWYLPLRPPWPFAGRAASRVSRQGSSMIPIGFPIRWKTKKRHFLSFNRRWLSFAAWTFTFVFVRCALRKQGVHGATPRGLNNQPAHAGPRSLGLSRWRGKPRHRLRPG